MCPDCLDDFLFAEIDKGTDDRQIHTVEVGFWRESRELPGIEQAHKEGLHGIVQMVRIGDFVHAVPFRIVVDGAAAEVGAGEAGLLSALASDRPCDIDFVRCKGNMEAAAKIRNVLDSEFLGKHGVDRECGQLELFFQTLAQNGKRIGKKHAVLAA